MGTKDSGNIIGCRALCDIASFRGALGWILLYDKGNPEADAGRSGWKCSLFAYTRLWDCEVGWLGDFVSYVTAGDLNCPCADYMFH